jgi:hypothetical protein
MGPVGLMIQLMASGLREGLESPCTGLMIRPSQCYCCSNSMIGC